MNVSAPPRHEEPEGEPPSPAPVAPAPATRKTVRRGADREFLPAALEIIDTPPSPIGLALMTAIAVLVVVALTWSWIGRVDVVAMAPGHIEPTGRVKVVQPADTGSVVAIDVANGSHVAAGAPLFRLDSREARADVANFAIALASLRAEAVRRRAAVTAGGDATFAIPQLVWPSDVTPALRDRETRVLTSEIGRLAVECRGFDAQKIQKQAEIDRLVNSIAAQKELLATHDIRVAMRTELFDRAAGSRAQVLDAEEARQTQIVALTSMEGQLTEARSALEVITMSRARSIAVFLAEQNDKLSEAERSADDLRERLEKANARLERTTITAPIAGTVTALAVNGIGQVVGAGQEALRIVPEGSRLELEAYVSNTDIGFIHVGQPVSVKIDSFPYTRFGGIEGTVKRIARDSVSDPDIQQSLTNPTASPRMRSGGGTQHLQNLIFPVVVELHSASMTIDGREIPLAPGMTAQVEIKTGSRRIFEYLLSPLVEVGSRALKER